jgi:tyrosyl-tRNA synthetase
MHIAQGLLKSVNVNKCTSHGTHSTFCFWVADWFALMNDKMGGDLAKIGIVGEYLIEVWKAAGMDLDNVEFRWASKEITENANVYWPLMLDVARRFNITRIKKCCQIMGRLEGSLTSAQVLYPLMQCTDVFFLKADICQLGVDQRKVNMLAREYCDAAKKKFKPVILSHHMLYGLKKGQEKMSKSDPDSAIFMEDTVEDVERKINKGKLQGSITVYNLHNCELTSKFYQFSLLSHHGRC